MYLQPTALPTQLCNVLTHSHVYLGSFYHRTFAFFFFLSHDCDSFWRSHFAIMKFRWRCEVGGQPRPLPGLRLVARRGCIHVIMYRSIVPRQLPRLITRKIELFLMSIQSSDPSSSSLPSRDPSCLVWTGRSIMEWWLRQLRLLRPSLWLFLSVWTWTGRRKLDTWPVTRSDKAASGIHVDHSPAMATL